MHADPNTLQAQVTLLPVHYIHAIGTLLTVKGDPLGAEVREAPETDILKVNFFAQSKLQFSNFAQEKVQKLHLKSYNMCELCIKKNEEVVKMQQKNGLRIQFLRFCVSSGKFCAVTQL